MFGKKKVKIVQEVAIKPSPTPRDIRKRPTPSVAPVVTRKVRRPVRVRRGKPIRAYVGANGHGKSLAAVMDLMPSLDAGRRVLSTVPLLDWRAVPDPEEYGEVLTIKGRSTGIWLHKVTGEKWERPLHPNYERLTSFGQIMHLEKGDVFLDEVAGVASSRQSQGLPAAIERMLQKLRHSDITLTWTSPAWARADLIIRETTQAVTICEGHSPEWAEDSDRLWPQNRRFEFTTYDSAQYTDWTEGKREKAKRLTSQRFYRPGSDAEKAYNTLGAVDTIISVTDSGRCVECGGTRQAPKCECIDYNERMVEHEGRRKEVLVSIGGNHR